MVGKTSGMGHPSTTAHRRGGKRWYTLAALALSGLGLLASCVYNPATGKKDFAPFMPGKDQQVSLGLQAAPEFEKQGGGRLNNPAVQAYVTSVGQRILAAVPKDQVNGYKFTYTVLNDDIVNAFALPGGPIYITKGILNKMDNEAELAFVLGHETGHVVAQHTARQMSKQTEFQLLLTGAELAAGKEGGTAVEAGKAAANFASQMYLLSYSREDERQADHLGLFYLVRAGYDPRGATQVMSMLEQVSGKGQSEWFATHPNPENRLKILEDEIRADYSFSVNNPKYTLNRDTFQQNVLRQLRGK